MKAIKELQKEMVAYLISECGFNENSPWERGLTLQKDVPGGFYAVSVDQDDMVNFGFAHAKDYMHYDMNVINWEVIEKRYLRQPKKSERWKFLFRYFDRPVKSVMRTVALT
jgi:hypothetical protein